MVKTKDNNFYISKVISHLDNILEYINSVEEEQFFRSKMLQSAISFEFVQVYENAKNITEEILLEINDFPLNELRGFRNKIVHDYGEVDYTIIYRTEKDDVPVLLEKMKQCEYR